MTRRRQRIVAVVTDARGRVLTNQRALGAWLAQAAPVRARGEVTIALVSDAVIRRLNRVFRDHDEATDVLSFAVRTPGVNTRSRLRVLTPGVLGDIVIATGVCRRQAREAGHADAVERRILALHGLLHLLGYDHDTDEGRMRRVEERLRRRAGLPGGLIARAPRRPPR